MIQFAKLGRFSNFTKIFQTMFLAAFGRFSLTFHIFDLSIFQFVLKTSVSLTRQILEASFSPPNSPFSFYFLLFFFQFFCLTFLPSSKIFRALPGQGVLWLRFVALRVCYTVHVLGKVCSVWSLGWTIVRSCLQLLEVECVLVAWVRAGIGGTRGLGEEVGEGILEAEGGRRRVEEDGRRVGEDMGRSRTRRRIGEEV